MLSRVRYLVDTSAIVMLTNAEVAAVLTPLLEAGEVATCGVIDLALYARVRDPAKLAQIRIHRLAAMHWLATADEDLRRALEIQIHLAEQGHHPAAWPEMVVAAVAERHGMSVLHCNGVFDEIAAMTGQPVEWVMKCRVVVAGVDPATTTVGD